MPRFEEYALNPEEVDEAIVAYQAGDSLVKVGEIFGVSRTTIRNYLKRRGIQRRSGRRPTGWRKRGGSYYIDRNGYRGTTDREQHNAIIHRGCWEAYYGLIPEDNVIHHIDGDRLNNEIDNLVCLTRPEHRSIHTRGDGH